MTISILLAPPKRRCKHHCTNDHACNSDRNTKTLKSRNLMATINVTAGDVPLKKQLPGVITVEIFLPLRYSTVYFWIYLWSSTVPRPPNKARPNRPWRACEAINKPMNIKNHNLIVQILQIRPKNWISMIRSLKSLSPPPRISSMPNLFADNFLKCWKLSGFALAKLKKMFSAPGCVTTA